MNVLQCMGHFWICITFATIANGVICFRRRFTTSLVVRASADGGKDVVCTALAIDNI